MPTDAEIVSYFHRHVVVLLFTFKKGTDVQNTSVTAFILSVSDYWFMITAGHCIRQIEELTTNLEYTLVKCQIVDSLGIGASHFQTIPFVYENSSAMCLSDNFAFDYGVIPLSHYYRQLLESNKIQALNEAVWKQQPSKVDFYLLLGIPSELVKFDKLRIDVGSSLHYVTPISEKPEGFTDVEAPLFYGRIILGEGLKSIKGMSGGPIFAFQQNEKGEVRYFLTALQSRWLPDSCQIAACPTKLLGQFLEDVIFNAIKDKTS